MPTKTKAKAQQPHWFSREKERVLNAVITAGILGALIFAVDYVTTDPEIAPTIQTVKQHDETIALLTQSVAQANTSVTGLAVDRAVKALKEAAGQKATLETKYQGVPVGEWPEIDRQLYLAAMAQLKSAEKRLGLDMLGDTP